MGVIFKFDFDAGILACMYTKVHIHQMHSVLLNEAREHI